MQSTTRTTLATAGVIGLSTAIASAHPGHGAHGFAQGITHPMTGLDHLLAMVGVGLWATQLGGRSRWLVPVAFLGAMSLGGALQIAGVHLPLVEAGVLVSVLVMGLLISTAWRLPIWSAAMLVGTFAICHGAAHASELAAGASATRYMTGFLCTTAMLHGFGIVLGVVIARASTMPLVRIAGGAMAAAAMLLALNVL